MNDTVVSLNHHEREKLGRLVDHFMVGEVDVMKLALEEAYERHIILPNKKTPYDTEEDALNAR